MSSIIKPRRSGGVIGTIGPIGGSGVFSLQERHALSVDNFDDVSLYLKMNGASGSTTFYDSSKYGHTVTANGNAQISTAESKFGGASAEFDGSNDRLEISSNSAFSFGTGSFTVEFWFLLNSVNAQAQVFVNVFTPGGFSLYLVGPSGYFGNPNSLIVSNRQSNQIVRSFTPSTSQWYHIAVCRSGSTMRLFIDGVQQGADQTATNNYGQAVLQIGGASEGTINGYIDDLRITKGVARYTGNFTPPQREFLP